MAWKSACQAAGMDKRIIVKYLVPSQDSFGEPTTVWTELKTIWASVEPISGRDFFQARQEQSELTHRIKTRSAGITPDMRLHYGTRVFEIASVINEMERGAIYTVMAKELV